MNSPIIQGKRKEIPGIAAVYRLLSLTDESETMSSADQSLGAVSLRASNMMTENIATIQSQHERNEKKNKLFQEPY